MKDAGVENAHRVLDELNADPVAFRIAEQRRIAAVTWKMDLDAIRAEGEASGRRTAQSAVLDVCELIGIDPTETQRASLADMTLTELDELRPRIKNERRWPE